MPSICIIFENASLNGFVTRSNVPQNVKPFSNNLLASKTSSVISLTRLLSPPVAEPSISVFWKFSHAPDNSSISPFKLSRIVSDCSFTVTFVISLYISLTDWLVNSPSTCAARIPSEPKASLYNELSSCSLNPLVLSCRISAISPKERS